MSTFYASYDRRAFFSAPQFNIMRHRYRGPRESYKVNLEINQMTFSVYRLGDRLENIHTSHLDTLELLMSGGEVEGVTTSDDEQVELVGLDNVVERIISLDKRLKVLES